MLSEHRTGELFQSYFVPYTVPRMRVLSWFFEETEIAVSNFGSHQSRGRTQQLATAETCQDPTWSVFSRRKTLHSHPTISLYRKLSSRPSIQMDVLQLQ